MTFKSTALLALALFATSCKDASEKIEPATAVIDDRVDGIITDIVRRTDTDTLYYDPSNPYCLTQEITKGPARIIASGFDQNKDHALQTYELESLHYRSDRRAVDFICDTDTATFVSEDVTLFVDNHLVNTGQQFSASTALKITGQLVQSNY